MVSSCERLQFPLPAFEYVVVTICPLEFRLGSSPAHKEWSAHEGLCVRVCRFICLGECRCRIFEVFLMVSQLWGVALQNIPGAGESEGPLLLAGGVGGTTKHALLLIEGGHPHLM